MTSGLPPLPSDLASAHALLLLERAERIEAQKTAALAQAAAARAQAIAARAQAIATSTEALIAHLRLEIEKLRRELYGSRSERKARLLEQMDLQLEDLETAATEDELASEKAAAQTQSVPAFARKRPVRKPFPEHLQRERVVIPAPCCCPSCGSAKLSKLGEDITERRLLAAIRQASRPPPAPFHVTPRGFAGPSLLAMVLFEKFGQHQPPRCLSYRGQQAPLLTGKASAMPAKAST
jgi:hypothetical protein